MNVREFRIVDHISTIRHWLSQRGLSCALADELPELGYIAFERDEPIAAGFIRKVEPHFAQLDGLITNPMALSADRHAAIDLVVSEIIKKSKELKIRQLLAVSVDEGTLERSKKHGFQKLPHTVIALDLGG